MHLQTSTFSVDSLSGLKGNFLFTIINKEKFDNDFWIVPHTAEKLVNTRQVEDCTYSYTFNGNLCNIF